MHHYAYDTLKLGGQRFQTESQNEDKLEDN